MEKFKGTPGPWVFLSAEQPVSNYSYTISSSSGCVGYWKGHKDWHEDSNWLLGEEDAKLIAAAPDLLEALLLFADEEIMAQLNGSEYVDPIDDEEWVRFRFVAKDYRKANAAIARALGKNDGEE